MALTSGVNRRKTAWCIRRRLSVFRRFMHCSDAMWVLKVEKKCFKIQSESKISISILTRDVSKPQSMRHPSWISSPDHVSSFHVWFCCHHALPFCIQRWRILAFWRYLHSSGWPFVLCFYAKPSASDRFCVFCVSTRSPALTEACLEQRTSPCSRCLELIFKTLHEVFLEEDLKRVKRPFEKVRTKWDSRKPLSNCKQTTLTINKVTQNGNWHGNWWCKARHW